MTTAGKILSAAGFALGFAILLPALQFGALVALSRLGIMPSLSSLQRNMILAVPVFLAVPVSVFCAFYIVSRRSVSRPILIGLALGAGIVTLFELYW